MNVLQVCPYDLARPGGVQRHVLDLSAVLVRAGHRVTVLAPGAAQPGGAHNGAEVRGVGRFRHIGALGTGFEVSLARGDEVDSVLRDTQPEVVHFHTMWTPFMPWQVWRRLDAAPRVARVATFHDTPPDGFTGRLMRAVFGAASARLSRRLQVAIPVSPAPARHLRLAPTCERVLLPGCIDLSTCRAMAAERRPDEATVLFVGRLEPRKGVLGLLQAWKAVHVLRPRARLVVCGDGPQRLQAEDYARGESLMSSVRFEGAVSETDKREWMRRATIFCAPSLYGESYGLVLAEAMAAGVPVVAAANAGYREVLRGDGAAGLVPPGDVPALACKLLQWLDDAGQRQRMTEWGMRACDAADVNLQLPRFEAIYADAVRSKREARGQ